MRIQLNLRRVRKRHVETFLFPFSIIDSGRVNARAACAVSNKFTLQLFSPVRKNERTNLLALRTMARFLASLLLAAAVAVASTSSAAASAESEVDFTAQIAQAKAQLALLESAQKLVEQLKAKESVVVSELSTKSTISVSAFAASSSGSGNSGTVGNGSEDFDIEDLPSVAPSSPKPTTATPSAGSSSGKTTGEVKTPTPTPASGASTLAPAAVAAATAIVYAML